MDIKKKINEIIPLNDRNHRESFSNYKLIDELNDKERKAIESALIELLYESPQDILITKTLSYMKSISALPAMEYALNCQNNLVGGIIIAFSIYYINKDKRMAELALAYFDNLRTKWELISSFDYLAEFKNERITEKIRSFTNNPDYLISYNAKKALSGDHPPLRP